MNLIYALLSILAFHASGQDLAWHNNVPSINYPTKTAPIVKQLGKEINTIYQEKLPVISPDGRTLYFERENSAGTSNCQGDIYFSRIDEFGNWRAAENIGFPLNNEGHNFISSISPDGKTLLLGNTYNEDGSQKGGGVAISHKTSGGWTLPRNLEIDNFKNKNKHGSFYLSSDQQFLLMAIESNPSFGGLDLYVSKKEDLGTWEEPVNLGIGINSAGTEINPFLAADGKTIYFSSNRAGGNGGFDIYLSRRQDSSWTSWASPVNLGSAINTSGHEISFSIAGSGKEAYYYGAYNATGNCDIYQVDMSQLATSQPENVSIVFGAVLNTKTRSPVFAAIYWEELSTGNTVKSTATNVSNNQYSVALPGDMELYCYAKAPGFYSVEQFFHPGQTSAAKQIECNLFLVPVAAGEIIQMNNVFFPQSKAELLPVSFNALQRLVTLLKEYPQMHIELRGHTDSQGDPNKNFALSEDRVKAVRKYICTQGIAKKRISLRAFGSLQSLASNQTEAGRKLNRRVEFKILKL